VAHKRSVKHNGELRAITFMSQPLAMPLLNIVGSIVGLYGIQKVASTGMNRYAFLKVKGLDIYVY